MAITVTSQKFKNLDFVATDATDTGTDYLMGCIGDKMQVITEFYVKVSSENITTIVSETTSNNTIRRTDNGSFLTDGFRIGNTITTTGMGADSGNYVISDVTDKLITISSTFTTKKTNTATFIYRTNIITACEYFYNLVENDAPDSFVSLTDSETQQRYTVSGISATGSTGTFVIASNSKGWAVDESGFGVTIDGLGISNHKQSFRITQVFLITPIALYSQLQNLIDGMPPAPDYMADRKCLRHLSKINMKIEKTDPQIVDTITFSRKGATAWFGEFLNGEPATYSLSSVALVHNSISVDEVQYDDTTATVGTIILSSANSAFGTGTTAVLHIIYMPNDPSEYTNTANKFRRVFAYDRVAVTCGGGSQSGIALGTNYSGYSQILSASATYDSASQITITANFKMGTALETLISGNETENRNYLIFATVQDPSITTYKGTDRNAVIVQVDSYTKDLDDSTLFTVNPNVKFYTAVGSLIGSDPVVASGDMLRAIAPFQVKNSGSQLLYNIGVRIDAVYTGDTGTFNLETWTADTTGFCLDDGVQEVSISEGKNYKLPADHVMNKVTVSRTASLDTATLAGYTLSYPFFIRYETWRSLDDAHCDFGDATQDWSVISNKSGWSVKAYITATVYDPLTDHETPFEQVCPITIAAAGATGSTGTWCVITTYDDAGTSEQYGDILDYENTTVVANFYGDFSALPSGTTGYYALLWLDQQTIGGVNWTYPISSYEDLKTADDLNPWIGATGTTNTCTITLVSSTHIQVKAKLNWQKLDRAVNNFNFRAKLDFLT